MAEIIRGVRYCILGVLVRISRFEKGRNIKVRDGAKRKVDRIIGRVDYYIRQAPEAFVLLTGGENITDMGRAIIYEEFLQPRYFGKDLSAILESIKNKIASLDK